MDLVLSKFESSMDEVQIMLQRMIDRIDSMSHHLNKYRRHVVSPNPSPESINEDIISSISESEAPDINESPKQVSISAVKATCDVEIIDSDEEISEGEVAIVQEQVSFSIASKDFSISPNRNQIPGNLGIHKLFLKYASNSLRKGVKSVYKNPRMLRVLEVNPCSGVRPFRWGNHECWPPPQCKYTETAVYVKDPSSILQIWVSVELLYLLLSQATICFTKGIDIMNEHLDLNYKAVYWLYFTVMQLLFGECSYLTCCQREYTAADVFFSGHVCNDDQFQVRTSLGLRYHLIVQSMWNNLDGCSELSVGCTKYGDTGVFVVSCTPGHIFQNNMNVHGFLISNDADSLHHSIARVWKWFPCVVIISSDATLGQNALVPSDSSSGFGSCVNNQVSNGSISVNPIVQLIVLQSIMNSLDNITTGKVSSYWLGLCIKIGDFLSQNSMMFECAGFHHLDPGTVLPVQVVLPKIYHMFSRKSLQFNIMMKAQFKLSSVQNLDKGSKFSDVDIPHSKQWKSMCVNCYGFCWKNILATHLFLLGSPSSSTSWPYCFSNDSIKCRGWNITWGVISQLMRNQTANIHVIVPSDITFWVTQIAGAVYNWLLLLALTKGSTSFKNHNLHNIDAGKIWVANFLHYQKTLVGVLDEESEACFTCVVWHHLQVHSTSSLFLGIRCYDPGIVSGKLPPVFPSSITSYPLVISQEIQLTFKVIKVIKLLFKVTTSTQPSYMVFCEAILQYQTILTPMAVNRSQVVTMFFGTEHIISLFLALEYHQIRAFGVTATDQLVFTLSKLEGSWFWQSSIQIPPCILVGCQLNLRSSPCIQEPASSYTDQNALANRIGVVIIRKCAVDDIIRTIACSLCIKRKWLFDPGISYSLILDFLDGSTQVLLIRITHQPEAVFGFLMWRHIYCYLTVWCAFKITSRISSESQKRHHLLPLQHIFLSRSIFNTMTVSWSYKSLIPIPPCILVHFQGSLPSPLCLHGYHIFQEFVPFNHSLVVLNFRPFGLFWPHNPKVPVRFLIQNDIAFLKSALQFRGFHKDTSSFTTALHSSHVPKAKAIPYFLIMVSIYRIFQSMRQYFKMWLVIYSIRYDPGIDYSMTYGLWAVTGDMLMGELEDFILINKELIYGLWVHKYNDLALPL